MTPDELARILRGNPDLVEANASLVRTIARPSAQPVASASGSPLEARFADLWQSLDGPALETEYRFDSVRRWKFDFAHLGSRVAIEVEGGTRSNGRHSRHEGYREDCIKYNAAVLAGWRVCRLTSDMITPDHVEPIIEFIFHVGH
jgi:very-short-patch-repair endonuclease